MRIERLERGPVMNAQVPKAKSLFLAALELSSPAERLAYLDEVCANDVELRRRVEALLDAHSETVGAFDRLAAQAPGMGEPPSPIEGPGQCIGPYKLLEVIGEG